MKNCSYCGKKVTNPKHVYLGYHPKCFPKYAKRGVKPEDMGKCVYCRNTLATSKEHSNGYHSVCSIASANGKIFKEQVIVPKQYRDFLEKTQLQDTPVINLDLPSLRDSSQKLAKEAAIRTVVKSKQAAANIKDIFKIADNRLGRSLDITNEEEAYAWASSEIETGETIKGIWAMAFADAEGNEQKQKALYIKYRAVKLLEELHRKNLEE